MTTTAPPSPLAALAALAARAFADPGEAVAAALGQTRDLLGMGTALVARVEGDEWRADRVAGGALGVAAGDALPLAETFCARVVGGGVPVVLADVAADPWGRTVPIGAAMGLGAYVGVPLARRDGAVHGTLCALDRRPTPLGPLDVATLRVLAHFVAGELEREGAQAALRASEARFRVAFDAAPIGMALVGPDGRVAGANRAFAAMLGRDEAALTETRFDDLVHPDDRATGPDHLPDVASAAGAGFQLEKRFLRADGEVVWGRLTVSLTHDEADRLVGLIAQVEDVTERRALEDRLRHRALHDALTGLPNRTLFLDRLGRALAGRRDGPVGVLFLDLDGFKPVNDRFGHDAGDRLLVEIGRRLGAQLRAGDTLARFGGDEFVALLPDLSAPEDARAAAGRLLAALAQPIPLGDCCPAVGVSIGAAVGIPGQVRPDDLLRAADGALYRAKAAGKGTVVLAGAEHHPAAARWFGATVGQRRAG